MGRVVEQLAVAQRLTVYSPQPERKVMILNARSGATAHRVREVARSARAAGAEVIEVGRGSDLQLAVRTRLRDGVRHYIVGGGDGTLRNVIQPLVGTEASVGIIPLGTYNRFARDARLPLAWRDALDVALNGRPRAVDVGVVNETPFLSAVTWGVHPVLLAERERLRPRWSPRLAIAGAMRTAITAFPVAELELEINTVRQDIRTPVFTVSVNRVSFDGGLPHRDTLTGGTLSAWWLDAPTRMTLAAKLAALLAGWPDAAVLREVAGKRMVVRCNSSSPIGIDGEPSGNKTCLSIRVRERALRIRSP